MHPTKVSDILGIINKIAPPVLAEPWDNVGLQVGDPTAAVTRIMVALDPVPAAVDQAISASCQLLVTHHPLVFTPLKRISTADQTGALLHRAIRHGLAVIALHTNYDVAAGGLNDLLADRLGLAGSRPLKVTTRDELVKLTVFVPATHREQVLSALFRHGGGIGRYDQCSFRTAGEGTFRPLDGAEPFIGTVGSRETVAEERLELLLRRSAQGAAVKALLATHPYEEPAFDLVPLLNEGVPLGLGRIGELAGPVSLAEFAARVKECLGVSALRLTGDPTRQVRRVALCGGSGASLLHEAARQGAGVLVTGDVKYHDAREAEALNIALVDAGHFATERLMVAGVADRLRQELATRRLEAEVLPCTAETDPFTLC
jgi:dinuclear metal center YbgI/SA1388 family protein